MKKSTGPKGGAQRLERRRAVLTGWLLVDEPAAGFHSFLFRLANDGLPQPELLAALDELAGIRQVLESSSRRDLIAVAIVRDWDEARDLRARIEDLAPGRAVAMDLIESESWKAAPKTWLEIARRAARDQS